MSVKHMFRRYAAVAAVAAVSATAGATGSASAQVDPIDTTPGSEYCSDAVIDRAFELGRAEVSDSSGYDVVNFSCVYDVVRLDWEDVDARELRGHRGRPSYPTEEEEYSSVGMASFTVRPGGPAEKTAPNARTDESEEEANARAESRRVPVYVEPDKGKPGGDVSAELAYKIDDFTGATEDDLKYGQKDTFGHYIWSSVLELRTRLYLSGYTSHGFKIGWTEEQARVVQFTYTAETRRVVNNGFDPTLQTFDGGTFAYLTSYSQPRDKAKGVYVGTDPGGHSYYVEMIILRIRDQASGSTHYHPNDISTLRFYCGSTFCTF